MAVWLSKYSCQKPLCLGGKVDALSWKCQKNRHELHLVAGSLHQLQLLLQETGFPRGGPTHCSQKHFPQPKICLEEAAWEQFLFFLGHAQPGKDVFNLSKQIRGCLWNKLAVRAAYLAAKKYPYYRNKKTLKVPSTFLLHPRTFITLLLLTRGPFKVFPLQ